MIRVRGFLNNELLVITDTNEGKELEIALALAKKYVMEKGHMAWVRSPRELYTIFFHIDKKTIEIVKH